MVKRGWVALVLFAGIAAAVPANAATIFLDTFDAENAGIPTLNYTAFANFSVTSGSVDLLGGGFAGHGLYVDLGGGTITSDPMSLIAGSYNLFFQLTGNQQPDGPNYIANWAIFLNSVQVGGGLVSNGPVGSFAGFNAPFTLAQGGSFTMSFGSPTGDVGALLDNITLSGPEQPVQTPVPEPASLLLFGSAAAYTLVRRHRSRRDRARA